MATPAARWPVRLIHPKCNTDENVFALEIAIERTGVIVINCACIDCDEEFVLTFGMLELVAEALLADQQKRTPPQTKSVIRSIPNLLGRGRR